MWCVDAHLPLIRSEATLFIKTLMLFGTGKDHFVTTDLPSFGRCVQDEEFTDASSFISLTRGNIFEVAHFSAAVDEFLLHHERGRADGLAIQPGDEGAYAFGCAFLEYLLTSFHSQIDGF